MQFSLDMVCINQIHSQLKDSKDHLYFRVNITNILAGYSIKYSQEISRVGQLWWNSGRLPQEHLLLLRIFTISETFANTDTKQFIFKKCNKNISF